MLGNTLRQTARAFRTSTRGFKSSAVSRGGGAGGHDDYVHAEHMYNILAMKNRKLKFGLGIVTLVGTGAAIPWIACEWQFKKAQG